MIATITAIIRWRIRAAHWFCRDVALFFRRERSRGSGNVASAARSIHRAWTIPF